MRSQTRRQGEVINPNSVPGKPSTLEGVAHTQKVDVEPSLIRGEVTDPNMDAHAHLEGAEPECPVDIEDGWSLEEEGTAGENTSVEEDSDPHVELQEPRVSHLSRLEEEEFLTFISLPPPVTFEAAVMQHALAVSAGTPAVPEPDRGADLEPQPHDTPPPNEAAEPYTQHLPEQNRAPTEVGGRWSRSRARHHGMRWARWA